MSLQRVLFMGSPDFAVPALRAVLAHPNVVLAAVITQPDQPKGRGKQLSQTPVKGASLAVGIPVFTPSSKKELSRIVNAVSPDLIVVVAYGRLLPAAITERYLCLNVHGSLLPHYRGASPIHAALRGGDLHTGVTLMHMNARMDAGDILIMSETAIADGEGFQSLHDRLSVMGGTVLQAFLDKPEHWLSQARPQSENEATYCQKLSSEDARLREDVSAKENWGIIRAFSPVPGAYVVEGGKRVKILEAKLEGERLIPLLVKPEGKNAMSYADYERGKGALSFFDKTLA